MIAAFLAIGAFWFWILVSVVVLLLFLEVEYEKPGWATVTCALFFAALWLFGDFNVLQAIAENPLIAVGCIVGYLLLGTGWSFGKWWFFVKRRRREYDRLKRSFLESKQITDDSIPSELKKEWVQWWRSHRSCCREERDDPRPRAGQHKARIMTWMVYWPWSMIWTIINDPIKRAFKEIFHRLKAVYQAIADRVFRGVDEDFNVPPDDDGSEQVTLLTADQVRERVARNRAEDALDDAPPGVDNFAGGESLEDRLRPAPAGLAPEADHNPPRGHGMPAK